MLSIFIWQGMICIGLNTSYNAKNNYFVWKPKEKMEGFKELQARLGLILTT